MDTGTRNKAQDPLASQSPRAVKVTPKEVTDSTLFQFENAESRFNEKQRRGGPEIDKESNMDEFERMKREIVE